MARCAALAIVVAACQKPAPGKDAIPKRTVAIKLDGEWDEPDWAKVAFRRQFAGEDGQLARPSSELRLLHDDHTLYVGLYAADENIQSHADAFEFEVGTLALRVDVSGQITPASPDIQAAVDHDGTLDDAHDDDEEWVVEMTIPLAKTGLTEGKRTHVKASRCDVTKDGVKRCGAWSGDLTLE